MRKQFEILTWKCSGCGTSENKYAKGLCKPCYMRPYSKEYRKKNKEKLALGKKQYCEEHKEEIKVKSHQRYILHRDEISQKSKIYREKNKVELTRKNKIYRLKNKERIRLQGIKYREENREEVNRRKREARNRDKDSINAKNRVYKREIYYPKNKERYRVWTCIQRAKVLGVVGSFTYEEWVGLIKKCNGYCPKCQRYKGIGKLTIDHIIPLANGGSNYISNIQPLCRSCNNGKRNREQIKYPLSLWE